MGLCQSGGKGKSTTISQRRLRRFWSKIGDKAQVNNYLQVNVMIREESFRRIDGMEW